MFYALGFKLVRTSGSQATSYLLEREGPYETIDENISREIWHPKDSSIFDGYGQNNCRSLQSLRQAVNQSGQKHSIEVDYEIRLVELWIDLTERFLSAYQERTNGLIMFHYEDMEILDAPTNILGFEVLENLGVSAIHNMWSYNEVASLERHFFKPFLNHLGLFDEFVHARCYRDVVTIMNHQEGPFYIVRISKVDW